MKQKQLLVVAIALLSMLAGAALYNFLQPVLFTEPTAGEQTPLALHAIPLTDLDQRETVFRDWQGDLLLVNFWAPWCAPCRREIPSLIQIQREYGERGVRVLGIAFDSEAQVRRFAEEYKIDYPLFLATNRAAMYNAALDNPSGSLPYTALLDRNLTIIFRHNGEMTLAGLRALLDKSL
ncbi:MAG: TlpA family protein disulfide reductase [Gammaproteobacteria bacterium]|nr:MAG: TlpA family protein disulfide reductase [Gammaproteobacteria bacterium]UCH41178.1 MAG: TlpA family protein disulfide reductase [Gammaproteobacteria bacterium]